MTHEELDARKRQLINEERKNPPGWWYLSFASDERGFLGAAIVQAQGPATATDRANRLRLNPHDCQILFVELDEDSIARTPIQAREKLLSKADLERYFGEIEKVKVGAQESEADS